VSEQQAEQSGGADTGSLDAEPAIPNSLANPSETVTASGQDPRSVESPTIAPGAEAVKADEPEVETTAEEKVEETAEAPKAEVPDAEMPKPEIPKAEMPKAEPFEVEAVAADASRPEAVNAEAVNSEVIKSSEVTKPDVTKSEVTKSASSKDEAPKSGPAKSEPAKSEPAKSEAVKSDSARIEAVKAERARARELLVMSPREDWKRVKANLEKGSFEKTGFDRTRFEGRKSAPEPEKEAPPAHDGRRRFRVMAAMLALAVIAGAAGGAFATIGLSRFTETASTGAPNTSALEASVARIDADIVALKAGLEQTTKAGLAQFNKTSDRLERIEKAQSEPNAKLARLSEAVDKLHAAAPAQAAVAPAAPTPVATAAPRDVTGTVTAPAGAQPLPMPQVSPTAAAAGTTPKTEVGRLPTVDNWVLRDVSHGSALIEGRTGLYEVFAGDPVPGLGRVEAIRKQDGRWVVITPKGLIVAR